MDRLHNNPVVAYLMAYVNTQLEPLRKRSDRGASAVEWAIIAGITVVAALAIGVAIKAKVDQGVQEINTPGGAGVTGGTGTGTT